MTPCLSNKIKLIMPNYLFGTIWTEKKLLNYLLFNLDFLFTVTRTIFLINPCFSGEFLSN